LTTSGQRKQGRPTEGTCRAPGQAEQLGREEASRAKKEGQKVLQTEETEVNRGLDTVKDTQPKVLLVLTHQGLPPKEERPPAVVNSIL
jgi:hypothetical protein